MRVPDLPGPEADRPEPFRLLSAFHSLLAKAAFVISAPPLGFVSETPFPSATSSPENLVL